MSSLATRPPEVDDPAAGPRAGLRRTNRPGGPGDRLRRLRERPGTLVADRAGATLAAAVALGLILVSLVGRGGDDLSTNTWIELALVAVGVGLAITAIVRGPRGPLAGAVPLLLFAAVACLTVLSITWSVQPDASWIESDRAVAYLGAFAGAVLAARLVPTRTSAIALAIAAATVVVCGDALLTKVFPDWLAPSEMVGRLRAPFDYFNAVGLMAALGVPACVWMGARREGPAALRTLAIPALTVLLTTLVLTYSRGSLIAAGAGLAVIFAAVPLRLRAALVFGLGAATSAVTCGWALATHALTDDRVALPARTTAGHAFGLVLIVVLLCAGAAGALAAFLADRSAVPEPRRRQIGLGLIVALALVPVLGIGALAASSRGLTGQISHEWHTLTDTNATVGNSADRLTAISNNRARYWSEGLDVGAHAPLIGVGALGYGTARLRYSRDKDVAGHAHSYVIETFADFGVVGLLLNLALLVGWAAAVRRTLRRGTPAADAAAEEAGAAAGGPVTGDPERTALLTLLAVAVVFGAHSAIDWTWFVPGCAVIGLLAAGWLAGRGPLAGRESLDPAGPRRAAASPSMAAPGGLRGLRARPAGTAVAGGLVLLALVAAWGMISPLRAQQAEADAVAALDRGDTAGALAAARTAASRDPLALQPLFDEAAILDLRGRRANALAVLQQAVRLQPANPDPWLHLGEYELAQHRPRAALSHLEASLYLDPHSPLTLSALSDAQTQAAGAGRSPSSGQTP